MERVIKFRAIIHLDSLDILMPSVAVYPNGEIGFDSEVFEKLLPKHHYIDWDDSCIRHDDEEAEIFENALSILTGEDWIWLDDSFTLQQFTGLTDKNSKDIYEGDILKGKSGKLFSVVWSGAGFKLKGKNRPYATSGTSSLEIIGNIYENPELLSTDKTKTV